MPGYGAEKVINQAGPAMEGLLHEGDEEESDPALFRSIILCRNGKGWRAATCKPPDAPFAWHNFISSDMSITYNRLEWKSL